MRALTLVTLACLAAPLAVALCLTVPGDYRRYGSAFESGGLPGFVTTPSVFITHAWVAASAAGMAASGLVRARRDGRADHAEGLRRAASFVAGGGAMYVVGLGAISRCVGLGGPLVAFFLLLGLVLPGLLLITAGWLGLLVGQRPAPRDNQPLQRTGDAVD